MSDHAAHRTHEPSVYWRERDQHVHFLLGHLLGQRDDHAVSEHGGGERHADASVSAGRLNQHISLLDPSALLGVEDHALADAILDTAAGVEVFALGQHLALDALALRDRIEAHQRRVADEVQNRLTDLRRTGQRHVRMRILAATRNHTEKRSVRDTRTSRLVQPPRLLPRSTRARKSFWLAPGEAQSRKEERKCASRRRCPPAVSVCVSSVLLLACLRCVALRCCRCVVVLTFPVDLLKFHVHRLGPSPALRSAAMRGLGCV